MGFVRASSNERAKTETSTGCEMKLETCSDQHFNADHFAALLLNGTSTRETFEHTPVERLCVNLTSSLMK